MTNTEHSKTPGWLILTFTFDGNNQGTTEAENIIAENKMCHKICVTVS
jgi:hypothetical protein